MDLSHGFDCMLHRGLGDAVDAYRARRERLVEYGIGPAAMNGGGTHIYRARDTLSLRVFQDREGGRNIGAEILLRRFAPLFWRRGDKRGVNQRIGSDGRQINAVRLNEPQVIALQVRA